MTDIHVRKIEFWGKNLLKSKSFMLDKDISCIILISTKDEKLEELFYNKIVDSVIDRIHPKNIYKDFSSALENINAFLSNWRAGDEKIKSLHWFIWIQFKKTLYFSTIWKASCYLHNSHSDIIEVTDKSEYPKDFSFISSWDIAAGESIVISNIRVLDILSKDDIKESFELWNNERTLDGLEWVLLREHEWKNIALSVVSLKETAPQGSKRDFLASANYILLRCMDNKLVKNTVGRLYQFRDYFTSRNLQTKQILLAWGILLSTYLLYTIVSWFFYVTTSTWNTQKAQQDLLMAQELIVTASENMNDSDVFSFNIQEAQERIVEVESEELFLWDVAKLKSNISILQKKFNGIESFETNSENTLVTFETPKKSVKIVDLSWKIYLVGESSVRGMEVTL